MPNHYSPDSKTIVDLPALSSRQRRLLERHRRLVWLIVHRHFPPDRRHTGRRMDLHQEGCIALAEAIRSHDPAQHGDFPRFAMARIRFALSRHAHEDGMVKVPYIAQRRRRAARREPDQKHHPDRVPRTHLMTDRQLACFAMRKRAIRSSSVSARDGSVSLGDVVRVCHDQALGRAVQEMSSTATTESDAQLLPYCARERWAIPEADYQLSYRELGRDLDCPHTRVVRRERQVFRKTAQHLRSDRRYAAAMTMARTHPAGLAYVPTAEELKAIESMNSAG